MKTVHTGPAPTRMSSLVRRLQPLLCLALVPLLTTGCTSFGRGVAQGMMERSGGEDVRQCWVEGASFDGVAPLLERQKGFGDVRTVNPERPELSVIYIHGMGTHVPGHGALLLEGLAETLALDVQSKRAKRVALVSPADPSQTLGELNVRKLTNEERSLGLVFYELTWSEITRPIRDSLAFDASSQFSSRRASINQAIRGFTNDTLPDPLSFAGNKRELIRGAVGQALCWSMSRTWNDLPELTTGVACVPDDRYDRYLSRITVDSHVLFTHSLGSRVVIDALQDVARRLAANDDPVYRKAREQLQQKVFPFFMLSNQLPLLEAGQDPQTITDQVQAFCGETAPRSGERFFKRVDLVAFSDPNDMFSYPVPQGWADQHLDSRLCARITNVSINIAHVITLFGLGEFADPLRAHSGYAEDERVRNLIAHGVGNPDVAPVVKKRCAWTEADASL